MAEPGRQRVQEEKKPQRTAEQRETHEAAVTAQHEKTDTGGMVSGATARHAAVPEPSEVAAEDWPEASAVPGDEERLTAMLAGLAQITDVGSLARLLRAVVNQCQRQRVQPSVIAATVQDA